MILTSLVLFVVSCYGASWSTLTVPHVDGEDDTPALAAALENYTTNSTILFESGITYNIWTPITFPTFTNVEVKIEGNLTLPEDISTVQTIVGSSSFPGQWFKFSGGTNVTLQGSIDPLWGWIDSHGQAWWNAEEQTNRPHALSFGDINNGVIRDMKLWKPIGWCFSTSGSSNLHIFNNTIMAQSDNVSAFPFNTDGFSAGGIDLLFEDNIIYNGDDCLTVGDGAENIHFRNSYCEGGHGLSIGSLGSGGSVANVQNVLIENVIMQSSLYAARFKSWAGGNGLARNITWRNITFNDVMFPIYVTQNYYDQEADFRGVIRDTNYIEGSCVSNPCWYVVANATGKEVVIFDLYPGTAENILAKGINATTETGAPVTVMCDPTTIDNDVGFVCTDGLFVPTAAGED